MASVWTESATVNQAGVDQAVNCPEHNAQISATVMVLLFQTQASVAVTPIGWALIVLLVSLHVWLDPSNTNVSFHYTWFLMDDM